MHGAFLSITQFEFKAGSVHCVDIVRRMIFYPRSLSSLHLKVQISLHLRPHMLHGDTNIRLLGDLAIHRGY